MDATNAMDAMDATATDTGNIEMERTKTQDEGASNLCIDDRLAPEFILLGTQKAGTSSFADMFLTNGIQKAKVIDPSTEAIYFEKELHIFDDHKGRYGKGKQFWLS